MKICLFGSSGLAGQGILKELNSSKVSFQEILTPTRSQVDLLSHGETRSFIGAKKPNIVIMAAGKVGGIQYNLENQIKQYSVNLRINENVIESCAEHNVDRLILLSSSCVYPKSAHTPMREESIFDGLPEPTNEGYALAKLTSIRHLLLRRNFENRDWTVMVPSNLYGPVPHYMEDNHVIPMLIRKMQESNESVEIWGDGSPIRQFLHNYDLGSAVGFVLNKQNLPQVINVAPRQTTTISELVQMLAQILKFKGEISYNPSKPNGHPDKSISGDILQKMGWYSSWDLKSGLENLVEYLKTRHLI